MRFLFAILLLVGCAKPQPPAAPVVRVEVWHDTVCPWCRIGLHNLETAAAGVTGARVEIVHHAFLLQPDAPAEGTDLRAHLAEKVGGDRLEAMFARVTQIGAGYGVRFNWDAVKTMPNTAASHALVAWAPPEKRSTVLAGLHRAYFEEGQDLGSPDVLSRVATASGLDASAARAAVTSAERLAAVRAEAAAASQRGIHGVPHFVIAGRELNGAQGPEALRAAIDAAMAQGTSAKQ